MVAEDAVLGLDACGHYFYRELRGGDDGLFSALLVLELLDRARQPMAALRRALPAIFSTPELRIPVEILTFEHALAQLSSALPVIESITIDGARLVLEDGTVLVRASGTEPVVSLRIEGTDCASLASLIERCMLALPSAEQFLRDQISPLKNKEN
jgi:phosphomannomutase